MLTFLQAIVIGLLQGVTELFPISSLGHTVLVPALIGGSWATLVTQEASKTSPYLAFVVGLHVATAAALIWYYRRDWIRLIAGFFRSIFRLRIETKDEKLAWLIVLATIPVGALGLALEHVFRTIFAKPLSAAIFLTINGLLLLAGEFWRRSGRRVEARKRAIERRETSREATSAMAGGPGATSAAGPPHHARRRFASHGLEEGTDPSALRFWDAIAIGFAQTGALLAGISRDGICMVAGLFRGLSHEDAARFAFLLSAPPILAAGLLKIPDLTGHLGAGIRGQVLAGSVAAFITAYLAVRFLVRYFRTRNLTPFALYCIVFGVSCMFVFA